jgi:hypothetical protein
MRLAAGHWDCFAFYVDLLYVGLHVERIAVGYYHVCGIAYIERT